VPGRKPHSRKKAKKRKKKKREKKAKKSEKKRWQARPFGGVIKKPGWWPGKKGEKAVDSTTGCELSV
jgi:hypothetical protein